jgi:hypothetical protein
MRFRREGLAGDHTGIIIRWVFTLLVSHLLKATDMIS